MDIQRIQLWLRKQNVFLTKGAIYSAIKRNLTFGRDYTLYGYFIFVKKSGLDVLGRMWIKNFYEFK